MLRAVSLVSIHNTNELVTDMRVCGCSKYAREKNT